MHADGAGHRQRQRDHRIPGRSDRPAQVQVPPPQHQGFIFGLVERIFAWLDKPWKAFAIAGLAILVALFTKLRLINVDELGSNYG